MKSAFVIVCLGVMLVAYAQAQDIDSVLREARAVKGGNKVIMLENEKTGEDIMLVPSNKGGKPKREAYPYPGEDDFERERRDAYPGEDDAPIKREAYPYAQDVDV